MTIYHVDKYYGANDELYYCVLPYSLVGTLLVILKLTVGSLASRIFALCKWLKRARFSEKRAQTLCEELMGG